MSKHSGATLPFSKANFYVLEQERNMLKITLDFLSTENQKLKSQIEDMKITVRHNKEQLEEYVTKITNKDKVFEKMNNQIEQLTMRLKVLDNLNKKKKNGSLKLMQQEPNIMTNEKNLFQSSTNVTTGLNSSMIVTKEEKNLYSAKRNDEKFKEFFSKQSEILEEMNILKDDVQFLLENKSKSKLKEHLDSSFYSNRSFTSNSNISSASNRNGLNDSMSILNSSINSTVSTNNKRKFNIKERFNFDKNLSEFLCSYNPKKNVLVLVDSKGDVWELIKRKDLNANVIKNHPDSIKSIVANDYMSGLKDNESENIIIKEGDGSLLNKSELEIGKGEMNLSKVIKDSELM